MTSNQKITGLILEALALPFLVIVAILFNMPNKDLGTIGILLLIGIILFLAGFVFSRLPKEEKENQSCEK